jgi:hypothetical protein
MKYRAKSAPVDAVRWYPGVKVAGASEQPVEIVYSVDESRFFIKGANIGDDKPADRWLDTEGTGQIWMFTMWDVQEGNTEDIDPKHKLYKRYAKQMGWKVPMLPVLVLGGKNDGDVVQSGHWIVGTPDSSEVVVADDNDFHLYYEPVPE